MFKNVKYCSAAQLPGWFLSGESMLAQNGIFLLSLLCYVPTVLVATHFPGLDLLRPFSSPKAQERAVYDLIERVFGSKYRNQFTLVVNTTLAKDADVAIVDGSPKETIRVTASSGVALAWGVNSYLRNCCNAHVSWDGNQLDTMPSKLPYPTESSRYQSIGKFRYFSNVVTFSYSCAWWDWKKWERHLDWLALNGINFPLASVGTEAILQKVFLKLGLSQAEIDAYFTGPAFLAWRRMGNIKAWAGPLSQRWHSTQLKLQKKIIRRMVDLGMIPVLPAFAGHVPDAVEKHFPNANISILRWGQDFNCTWTCIRFAQPTDPLFQQIGASFLKEMKKEFGLYHAYSADLFMEMRAPSYDNDYLDAVGKATYQSMVTVDPDAVWVMQAWPFVGDSHWRQNDSARHLITSVPRGKLLVLDLYSEQIPVYPLFDSFYGQPFVWNVLHNFGGVQGLFGAVSKINQNLSEAIQFPNSTLVGTGLAMEGIYQNYPIYQFTLDRMWSKKIDQSDWITRYAIQRYGQYDKDLDNAWQILWTSVYDQTNLPDNSLTLWLNDRPNLRMDEDMTYGYDPQSLCTAWTYFVNQSDVHQKSDLFRLDLVDVTREVLMLIIGHNYKLFMAAYGKNDSDHVAHYGNKLIEIHDDLETILLTHEHFLFGRWVKEARNQITLWGPTGVNPDYARKQWAGLVSDYYRSRWLLFVNMVLDSTISGKPFSESLYNELVFTTVEQPFTFKRSSYPDEIIGDSVALSKRLRDRYISECQMV